MKKIKISRDNFTFKKLKNLNKELNEELLDYEGTTKYGEFVTSYFYWLGPTRQKENAVRLDEITKINIKNKL